MLTDNNIYVTDEQEEVQQYEDLKFKKRGI
jgi:hypothetical protein